MSQMSGTPRTDSQSVKGYETYNTSEYTHKSCAMQLEHELNLARLLLDRVYGVFMPDNTGNEFIDELVPVIHDVAQFCRGTSNPSHQPHRTLCGVGLDGVVRREDSNG